MEQNNYLRAAGRQKPAWWNRYRNRYIVKQKPASIIRASKWMSHPLQASQLKLARSSWKPLGTALHFPICEVHCIFRKMNNSGYLWVSICLNLDTWLPQLHNYLRQLGNVLSYTDHLKSYSDMTRTSQNGCLELLMCLSGCYLFRACPWAEEPVFHRRPLLSGVLFHQGQEEPWCFSSTLPISNRDLKSWCLDVNSHMALTWGMS